MTNLTDYIEDYIKKLLSLSSKGYIEIQRNELAGKFKCVPSQINYVLKCRFSRELGYIVEGKRGGGGYIRIYRIKPGQIDTFVEGIRSLSVEKDIENKIGHYLKKMCDDNVLTMREVRMIGVIVEKEIYASCGLDSTLTQKLQWKIFVKILDELFKDVY